MCLRPQSRNELLVSKKERSLKKANIAKSVKQATKSKSTKSFQETEKTEDTEIGGHKKLQERNKDSTKVEKPKKRMKAVQVSGTIFDVANEFPDILLYSNKKPSPKSLGKAEVTEKPHIHFTSTTMLTNRHPVSSHRPSGSKKRVDIVYRSKWITNNFVVGDPVGAGSFGKVWTVECRKKPSQLYALKVPAPGFSPKHIAMELKSLIHKMPLDETLQYMRNLFIALHHIHRYRVIHRDIKPANFLYNRAKRRYLLVDFGLSHFAVPIQGQKASDTSLKENIINSPIDTLYSDLPTTSKP
uniref:Serine/threonine-protein kinase greatwall n=1 Tax=Angiostrongylus cantonensis TaxID=6313 RepID=A0A158PAE3_ANGCA